MAAGAGFDCGAAVELPRPPEGGGSCRAATTTAPPGANPAQSKGAERMAGDEKTAHDAEAAHDAEEARDVAATGDADAARDAGAAGDGKPASDVETAGDGEQTGAGENPSARTVFDDVAAGTGASEAVSVATTRRAMESTRAAAPEAIGDDAGAWLLPFAAISS